MEALLFRRLINGGLLLVERIEIFRESLAKYRELSIPQSRGGPPITLPLAFITSPQSFIAPAVYLKEWILIGFDGRMIDTSGLGTVAVKFVNFCVFASAPVGIVWLCHERQVKPQRRRKLCRTWGGGVFRI